MFKLHMSFLYVSCIEFSTNRFVGNFFPYFKIFISFTLFLKNILGFIFYRDECKVGYNLYFSRLYNKSCSSICKCDKCQVNCHMITYFSNERGK